MKLIRNKKGYTLIELLAVMIILVSVGVIITAILVTSLRTGNKSNTVNQVRENGNFLIAQMSKMITYARTFDGVSTDGVNYVTNCIVPTPLPLTPTPTPIDYKYIKITSFDNGQTVFSCSGSTIASNGASLIDTSNMTISTCSFSCNQTSALSGVSIDINFTIKKANVGLFVENNTTIDFNTTVTPRNF